MLMILITPTTKITSNDDDDDDEYLGFCFTCMCVRVDYCAVQTDFY